jgi:hypothetical protein
LLALSLAVTMLARASLLCKATCTTYTLPGLQHLTMPFELPKSVFKRGAEDASTAENKSAAAASSVGPGKKTKTQKKFSLEELSEIVHATAELAVETKTDTRHHDALLTRTMLVAGDHPAVTAALEEGKEIHLEQQRKKGQDLGSPFHRIALKFYQGFAQSPQLQALPVDHKMRVEMEAWWDELGTWDELQMKEEIPIFQVTKPKIMSTNEGLPNYAKVRFAMGMRSQKFKETFELKWQLKAGAAPQTQRERKVRALLKKLG